MAEFRSKIEDLVETEELKIRQEIAFGKYSNLMPEASKRHPAKYNPEIVEFLVERYTRPGDTVADVMAGTGLLGVIAAPHGRNAIQVELEPRYFEWMEEARENVEKLNTLTEKGRILNILGDSRRLTELLAERVGAVIVSPPYGDAVSDDKEGPLAGADIRRYGRWREGTARKHSYTQHLVPVKPDTNIDAVITSPPYADTKKGKADVEKMAERWDRAFREHAGTWNSWSATSKTPGGLRAFKALGSGYSENANNIGNLPLGPVDAVITSPPYSGGIGHDSGDNASNEYAWRLELQRRYTRQMVSEGNIARLQLGDTSRIGEQGDLQQLYKKLLTRKGKPTYLSEMLLVYKNMFEVLKPGGVACVVVKPFIKDRKPVDLPYITWCLLRAVGFVLEKAYKWRIEKPSFWRLLYSKRFPAVPQVSHEYVVVVRKPGGGGV
jgi:DNA modification methylase